MRTNRRCMLPHEQASSEAVRDVARLLAELVSGESTNEEIPIQSC